MMNPLISNPEINSSQDEFINKWLETINPTSFSCSIDYSSIIKEPDYLEKGGELDFPEDFEILFWIRNEE